MNLQTISASASPEVPMNENFALLDWSTCFGMNPEATSGTTWGYHGTPSSGTTVGLWGGNVTAAGTISLTNNTDNYISVAKATGVVTHEATAGSPSVAPTSWNDTANYARAYKVVVSGGQITAIFDYRAGQYGVIGGPEGSIATLVWRQATDNDTLVIGDAENGVAMNHATAKNLTVPPNSSVPFTIGTSILVYQEGAGQTTIVPGSGVTIRCRTQVGSPLPALATSGQYAEATLIKRDTNEWILSGDLQT